MLQPARTMNTPDFAAEMDPEQWAGMTRDQAIDLIGEPTAEWRIYATARHGSVAAGDPKLRAAMLLYDLEEADLCQRRTDSGTEYLIQAQVERGDCE